MYPRDVVKYDKPSTVGLKDGMGVLPWSEN